jgi:YVTN family beta-propeller protein
VLTRLRFAASSIVAALVITTCASSGIGGPAPQVAEPQSDQNDLLTPTSLPIATPAPTPEPLYTKLRVFVASESTNAVFVFDGAPGKPFEPVGKIPVGTLPHQMGTSPDGKWIAVNNRMADSTSIIDPVAMKEVARIRVGRQPHGITWSPDAKTLFVGHERDTYIARIEAGTWKPLPPLIVGVPQHVLTIPNSRPNELWYTLTNTSQADVLRVYDLATDKITNIKVADVHDAYFTPDESEVWSSSSGFLDRPSDRMVIYDPATKAVKSEIHLTGHYPFHTMKPNQDGAFFMQDRRLMVISDHTGPGLMWIDWKERRIVGETILGQQPFHTTYDPEGERLLTTTNVDGMVNVIDIKTRAVIQKIPVPKPHGIGSVPIP